MAPKKARAKSEENVRELVANDPKLRARAQREFAEGVEYQASTPFRIEQEEVRRKVAKAWIPQDKDVRPNDQLSNSSVSSNEFQTLLMKQEECPKPGPDAYPTGHILQKRKTALRSQSRSELTTVSKLWRRKKARFSIEDFGS